MEANSRGSVLPSPPLAKRKIMNNNVDILFRMPELQKHVPLSRSHIYSMISKGQFPAPIKLGPRASAWLASEIDEWLQERIHRRKEQG